MIPYNDLIYINKKLSLMIWVNLVAISALTISSILIAYFELYYLFVVIGIVAAGQLFVSHHIHVKLRKHARRY
ncbi:MAG TPA: hypothetical protein DGG95_13035 [Cytophagales bacterium]|jgi:hypothetical protein|nr:hypothetical protein [Cytophagales bacterium]